ncbi:hypothetical protein [Serinibacter arcticus]|nr:hypothetical protein [Serinibacter arcticus]
MRTTVLRDDRAQRLQKVQAALERAETATGLRPVGWGRQGVRGGAEAVAAPAQEVSAETFAEGFGASGSSTSQGALLPADASWLPVTPAIGALLPHGAVRRGTSLVVEGSTALLLHLTASLMADGAWSALVSHPDLGLAAALDAGVDPDRCVMVPDPGPAAAAVLGALTDGFDVVVVGACSALDERDRRAVSQRVRHRGAVLLSTGPWPGSETTLTVEGRTGAGLDSHGRLVAEELVVTSSGRGLGSGRTRRVRVGQDDGATRLTVLPHLPGATGPRLPRIEIERRAG